MKTDTQIFVEFCSNGKKEEKKKSYAANIGNKIICKWIGNAIVRIASTCNILKWLVEVTSKRLALA